MRRPLIIGNWKMNTGAAEAESLASALLQCADAPEVDVVVCPPYPWLVLVGRILAGSRIRLGAQNAHWESSGAYTGEVSPTQLSEVCEYVLLGHSERRTVMGETDEQIARKVEAAADAGLTVVLAVGENETQHDRGEAEAVVLGQLRAGLSHRRASDLVVAYEPVWAIGAGKPATPEHAQTIAAVLRAELAVLGYDTEDLRILYGGSVIGETFDGFIQQPDVDGALVGGASLDAEKFGEIVRVAASAQS